MSTTYTPTDELLATPEADRIRWAEALESGEYKQGYRRMFVNGSYCCLGVWERINGALESGLLKKALPLAMYNPTHLGDRLPQYIKFATSGDGIRHSPQLLNDDCGFTFPEIAQLLRGNSVSKEAS